MATTLDPQLIAALYQGALDPGRWQDCLVALSDAFHARTCAVWTADLSTMRADFSFNEGRLAGSSGFGEAQLNDYVRYYSTTDVWCERATCMQEGEVSTAASLYPVERLRHTEFYNDFLRGQDLFYAMGGCVAREGIQSTLLTFIRPQQAGDFSAGEVQRFRALMPHVQNAQRLYGELHHLQLLSAAAVEALETLAAGVLLFSRGGRLLHATLRARQLLAQVAGLHIGAGTLHIGGNSRAQQQLQSMLDNALATGNELAQEAGGSVHLPCPGGSVLCTVTPLPPQCGMFGGIAGAALFCSAPQAAPLSLAEALRASYHMTPAEALLTEALVNGQSLKEHAAQRDVSLNTVRSQLKAAVAKTGARRQADLVRIVLTGPALLRAHGGSMIRPT